MPIRTARALPAFLALAAACSSSGTALDAARTLENCGGTVTGDVPAFYKKYFKCVDLSLNAKGSVVLTTKNLPPHPSPYYAENSAGWVAFDSQGGTRQQNPNRLEEQSTSLAIPASPVAKGIPIGTGLVDRQAGTSDDEYRGETLGLALDGTQMFHGVAAPGDDIAQEEHTFDSYEGHPQNSGIYHYHAMSPGPLEVLKSLGLVTKTTPGEAEIELYAVMCDGTFVLGCTELDGSVPTGTDFDAQNGHVGDLKDKDGTTYFTGRYHTHVCRAKFTKHLYAPEIQYYGQCNQ